jgi:hypothetical protein
VGVADVGRIRREQSYVLFFGAPEGKNYRIPGSARSFTRYFSCLGNFPNPGAHVRAGSGSAGAQGKQLAKNLRRREPVLL